MNDSLYIFIVYTCYFISTTVLSFLVNGLFLKFASTLGTRNLDENFVRWSSHVKPSLGGISFFLIFLLSIASYPIFFEQNQVLFDKHILGILAAGTLAFLLGLSDDAYNTRPVLKFVVQIICGVILISTGTYISIFANIYINYAFTLFWVVALMNSINMLDNMDAISTVVSITTIMGALLVLFLNNDGRNIYIIILIGVMAALLGFLYFNWHPSKMFMGDTGSQFLGLFLAAIGIIYFWNYPPDVPVGSRIASKQFIMTILTFAIPIIDTVTVVINRMLKGKSPFIGGKDHTTHSLFFRGLSERRIAVLYAGICFVSMFFNFIIIKYIDNWNYIHIILFSIYFLTLFWFLYAPTRKNKH